MLDANRPTTPEAQAVAIWDEETGETWAEALARFDTFGPRLTAAEVLALPAGTEVWTFGYGDDPEGFTTITVEEMVEDESDPETLDIIWGPFAAYDPS